MGSFASSLSRRHRSRHRRRRCTFKVGVENFDAFRVQRVMRATYNVISDFLSTTISSSVLQDLTKRT